MKKLIFLFLFSFFCYGEISNPHINDEYIIKLDKECNSGDGIYSSCVEMLEHLKFGCQQNNIRYCGEYGWILNIDFKRREESVEPLYKACKNGAIAYCYHLYIFDVYPRGNLKRAKEAAQIACENLSQTINKPAKEKSCFMSKKIDECLKNKNDVNPVKCSIEAMEKYKKEYHGKK